MLQNGSFASLRMTPEKGGTPALEESERSLPEEGDRPTPEEGCSSSERDALAEADSSEKSWRRSGTARFSFFTGMMYSGSPSSATSVVTRPEKRPPEEDCSTGRVCFEEEASAGDPEEPEEAVGGAAAGADPELPEEEDALEEEEFAVPAEPVDPEEAEAP